MVEYEEVSSGGEKLPCNPPEHATKKCLSKNPGVCFWKINAGGRVQRWRCGGEVGVEWPK